MPRSSLFGAPFAAAAAAAALGGVTTLLGAPLPAGIAMGVAEFGSMWLQRLALPGELQGLELVA
jgi:hypothetical protein